MNYALRNRDTNVLEPKIEGGIPIKRHAAVINLDGSIDEPKLKRQALADLNGVSHVLSGQLLIDSTKKPIDPRKRSNCIKAKAESKISVDKHDNDDMLPEVSIDDDPCPNVDFDKEAEIDPHSVSTFAEDIFRYYKFRERFFKIGDYLKKQKLITRENRSVLIDWMVGVQESFELNHETLYLAVKLVDMYLDRSTDFSKGNLQLLAGASVFIAAKFDERAPPPIDDILYICEDAYTQEQFMQMERDVLIAIGFDLGSPLSYRFLRRYGRVIKLDMPTLTLARYVLETSLLFYEFVHVSESLMASACLLLALRMKKMGDWSSVLHKYTGYKLSQVEPLMYRLNHMVLKRVFNNQNLKTIFEKYSHEVFYAVTGIPLLESTIPLNESICAPEIAG